MKPAPFEYVAPKNLSEAVSNIFVVPATSCDSELRFWGLLQFEFCRASF